MIIQEEDFPCAVKISFNKLFDSYRERYKDGNEFMQQRYEQILAIEKKFPMLSEGLTKDEDVEKYKPQIDLVFEDLFSPILETNEIKIATIPFQDRVFKTSKRFENILNAAGPEFQLELMNMDRDNMYIMGCSLILNMHFGYKADFRRPLFYEIPDAKGKKRSYRVLFNGDYVTFEKTDKAKDISEDDYLELLENFDNVDLWKEKFPPNSWIIKGFVLANMYDATTDVSLSQFKENLLKEESKDESFIEEFEEIISTIFGLSSLKVGYTIFDQEEQILVRPPSMLNIDSFILNGEDAGACNNELCEKSYAALFENQEAYCIADVAHYYKMYPKNTLYKKLHHQKIGSAIVTSIVVDGVVSGIMEIVSPNALDLNSVSANKLKDIMPFLVDSVRRSNEKAANEIELIIQRECTSIHPSVHWKFKKEARRFHKSFMAEESTSFKEVVFDDVYPLYGQIDIKGSSQARNIATQKDLELELLLVQKIIRKVSKVEDLPIYEQIDYRIGTFLKELEERLQVDSERNIMSFLKKEILPLFVHLKQKDESLNAMVDRYYDTIDSEKGFIYRHRKDYDESVMLINKTMASILDKKQVYAQLMYPHYFERFKTDGVEHSLYIGESITKKDTFNKIYLYNLRLWQLQAMCEMENQFYRLKKTLPLPLDVASMLLVFGGSLSLRFRMDEKRFDVDGTYNARYEVVKKRVDKANIKGTNERITQAGKISIIYSQSEDEKEYLKYVHFLQSKKQLSDEIEIVELDDLQGVTGLKAIRVNVLYHKVENDKEYYTYEDLMDEIEN